MEIKQLIERTFDIRQATPTPSVKQRLADVAADLSKAGDNQARVELLNESVLALTNILYERDEEGRYANVDSRTHRLLVPAPWGSAGWRKWGVRNWEAVILRKILIVRYQMRRGAPLFDYSEPSNQWFLNVTDYPTLDKALAYWKARPITLRDWRLHADAHRQEAQARMARRRSSGS